MVLEAVFYWWYVGGKPLAESSKADYAKKNWSLPTFGTLLLSQIT